MKLSGKVGNWPLNEWLNFDGDLLHGSGSCTILDVDERMKA